MLGRFPAEIQTYVVIAAGASAVSSEPEAAHSFVKFLLSPQAVAVFQALNFEAAAR
jgi:ABC-type molybdate transport system substrate-binding protein